MNIYVGNLPYSVTEDELRNLFGEFGEVSSANIITDRYTGQSKGFGFVEMPNQQEAEEAIGNINDSSRPGTECQGEPGPSPERPPPPGTALLKFPLREFLFRPAGVEVRPGASRETHRFCCFLWKSRCSFFHC